jgi:predicted nucleic acid-binding protein
MWLALEDLYRAKWTDAIHDEWIESLLKVRPDLKREQLERTRALMNANVRDCLVTDYEDLIAGLSLPDPDDRHVLAAAIKSSAQAIVTFNLNDFPVAETGKYGVEAIHPDEFLICQMDLGKHSVLRAAKRHRASLKSPPKSVDDYLTTLEGVQLVQTAAELRRYRDFI